MNINKIFLHNARELNQFAVAFGRDTLDATQFEEILKENFDMALGLLISERMNESQREFMAWPICNHMLNGCINYEFSPRKLQVSAMTLAIASNELKSKVIGKALVDLALHLQITDHHDELNNEKQHIYNQVFKHACIPAPDQMKILFLNKEILKNPNLHAAVFYTYMEAKGKYGKSERDIIEEVEGLFSCKYISQELIELAGSEVPDAEGYGDDGILYFKEIKPTFKTDKVSELASNEALSAELALKIFSAAITTCSGSELFTKIYINPRIIEVLKDIHGDEFYKFLSSHAMLTKNPALQATDLFSSFMEMEIPKRVAFIKFRLPNKYGSDGQIESEYMRNLTYSQYFQLLSDMVDHKPYDLSAKFLRATDMNRLLFHPQTMTAKEREMVSAMCTMQICAKHYLMNSNKAVEPLRLTQAIELFFSSGVFDAQVSNPFLTLDGVQVDPASYILHHIPTSSQDEVKETITASILKFKTNQLQTLGVVKTSRPSL